jgi:hypothetical protein
MQLGPVHGAVPHGLLIIVRQVVGGCSCSFRREDGLLFITLAIIRVGVVREVTVGGTRSMIRLKHIYNF